MKDFWFKCWMAYKKHNPLKAHIIEMNIAGNISDPHISDTTEQTPLKEEEPNETHTVL